MGGNAMIGLSTIACLNGGRERIAPVVTAIGVFLTMAVFHKVLNFIPISALTGVMANPNPKPNFAPNPTLTPALTLALTLALALAQPQPQPQP